LDYSNIVPIIRDTALKAGQEILHVYDSGDFGVDTKSDDSPVTRADRAADDIIYASLKASFPNIAIVTEEQAETHNVTAKTFFIVDPLDGTKEFIKRRGEFTVNIALVENGVPTLGVVYAPAIGRLFYTDENGQTVEELGYHRVGQIGETIKLSVSEADNSALTIVASKSHRDQATDNYISKYQIKDMTGAGSSLKFCLVASGEADFYPRLGRTMEWDTAAGHAVVLGAGGQVLCFDTHAPLKYGKDGFENPFFIVMSPKVELR
jgi:3'(2'), 5'-bisphosphate nucleotidase